MIEFLKAFPTIFGIVGVIVGALVVFWAHKKYGPIRAEIFREQLDAQINLSKLQSEAHIATLQMQKEHWAEELAKLEKERDRYRNDLHAERELHNKSNLRVQELEMRPSVEVLQTEQQGFYKEMSKTMSDISIRLKEHDESIPSHILEFQKPILNACKEISDGMKILVETLKDCGTLKSRKRKTL